MKDFLKFIKKLIPLYVILFLLPVIIIAIFAIKEYYFKQIDMSAGEWANLFGASLVILAQ